MFGLSTGAVIVMLLMVNFSHPSIFIWIPLLLSNVMFLTIDWLTFVNISDCKFKKNASVNVTLS